MHVLLVKGMEAGLLFVRSVHAAFCCKNSEGFFRTPTVCRVLFRTVTLSRLLFVATRQGILPPRSCARM